MLRKTPDLTLATKLSFSLAAEDAGTLQRILFLCGSPVPALRLAGGSPLWRESQPPSAWVTRNVPHTATVVRPEMDAQMLVHHLT